MAGVDKVGVADGWYISEARFKNNLFENRE